MSDPSSIVILTGAGVSKESGLSTFRDEDGVWAEVRIEDVATPGAFRRNPDRVQAFYNARRRRLVKADVIPNAAHGALARLERAYSGEVLLVTQNIDDLHERAGSRNLIHMHGELLKIRCERCGDVRARREDLAVAEACGRCGEVGGLRPHVVWFGETPFAMEAIQNALTRCGLFISIGTSGNVYPAAGFVELAGRVAGARTVELNLEPSAGVGRFDEAIHGPAAEIVPAFVDHVLEQGV